MTAAATPNSITVSKLALRVDAIQRGSFAPLHGISFTLAPGSSAVLFSRDGSANAVLRAVIGVDPVDTGVSALGEVQLSRTNTQPTRSNAKHVGLLLRDPVVTEGRTLIDHIAQGLSAPCDAVCPAQLSQVSESLGFNGADSAIVARLPLALQYRVAIGRAIVGKPALIAADDPYVDLPDRERHLLIALLNAVADEHQIGVLYATIDQQIAERSQHVFVIEGGRIVAELHGARDVERFFAAE